MAIGLDTDTEYARRSSIPSGGAGTLSDGGFTNCFVGVWVYRPSATATYALTAAGAIIHMQAGAREVVLGFDSAGSLLSDLSLRIIYNSGGGAGTPANFPAHAGDDFLDEWVYYFIAENSTDGQIAGYIRLADLATAVTLTRANDNAGSQFINTLTFGNTSGGADVVLGHYAFARAVYGTGMNATDALAYAASDAADAGDWGFWPLANNADTGDDSGNARDLTFNGTLTSESDPVLLTVLPVYGGGSIAEGSIASSPGLPTGGPVVVTTTARASECSRASATRRFCPADSAPAGRSMTCPSPTASSAGSIADHVIRNRLAVSPQSARRREYAACV